LFIIFSAPYQISVLFSEDEEDEFKSLMSIEALIIYGLFPQKLLSVGV